MHRTIVTHHFLCLYLSLVRKKNSLKTSTFPSKHIRQQNQKREEFTVVLRLRCAQKQNDQRIAILYFG